MDEDMIEELRLSPLIREALDRGYDIETLRLVPAFRWRIDTHVQRIVARRDAVMRVRAILGILDARKIRMTGSQWERIAMCREQEIIDRWFKLALTAESVADLFA
jgi:hypothetical protein